MRKYLYISSFIHIYSECKLYIFIECNMHVRSLCDTGSLEPHPDEIIKVGNRNMSNQKLLFSSQGQHCWIKSWYLCQVESVHRLHDTENILMFQDEIFLQSKVCLVWKCNICTWTHQQVHFVLYRLNMFIISCLLRNATVVHGCTAIPA